MKKTIPIIVAIAAVAWYLGSPLFTNTVVEEEFPVDLVADQQKEMPDSEKQNMLDDMTDEEVVAKAEGMTESDVENLSDEEKEDWMERMDDIGKTMPEVEVEDAMEETEPTVVAEGSFAGTDSFHKGSGLAKVYSLADASSLVRFEDFSVTNGPALSVWLVKDASGDVGSGYLDLGKLKGNKGNQNYTIPADTDLSEYKSVIVRCVPFRVTFAVAAFE